jgi:hypothetical protein
MKQQDIATLIISEATGLDLIDSLRLTSSMDGILLDDLRLEDDMPCERALEALARWRREKSQIRLSMMLLWKPPGSQSESGSKKQPSAPLPADGHWPSIRPKLAAKTA